MSASLTVSRPVADAALLRRRRVLSGLGWALSFASLALLVAAVAWILGLVLVRGIGALRLSVFTEVTQGTGGGLLNAIEGTFVISAGALLLAVPFGVIAGTYVAEFPYTRWAKTIRFFSDVLVGVPSIVLGYFGYITMVQGLGWKFSVAAGSITVALICLSYICRTTELALQQVPVALREAAYAIGAGDRRVILGICLPSVLPSILTGVLLALAISVGETAPLIYTAGWSSYLWNGHLTNSPIGYLTYAIWNFINEPFAAANQLAYAAAFLVSAFVLLVSIASRLLLQRRPV